MRKNYYLLLLFLVFGLFYNHVKSQVAIGNEGPARPGTLLDLNRLDSSGRMGGLLLPNSNITDLEKIPIDFSDVSVQGLEQVLGLTGTIVYNTNTTTGVGIHIWDGYKWKPINAPGSFTSNCTPATAVPVIGGNIGCQITDPDCKTAGEYKFEIIMGKEYANLSVADAGQGKFEILFDPNNYATSRSVVVLVISPCGRNDMFVYTQNGDNTGCGTTSVPDIVSSVSSTLCSEGAVYLSLPGASPTGNYIWTLNGKVLNNPNNDKSVYIATEPGKYIVYGDKIGCPNSKSIIITKASNSYAPAAPVILNTGNSGEACGAGGSVILIAANISSGTIRWYKDGIFSGTGTLINATKGYWQAVVVDGTCSSLPSKGINVTENLTGTNTPPSNILINGLPVGTTTTSCKGGSLLLQAGNVVNDVTYEWYVNDVLIGTGVTINYSPTSSTPYVIRLRSVGIGCSGDNYTMVTPTSTTAPLPPFINASTTVLCNGQSILIANPQGSASSYLWYKDGVLLQGKTTQSITVTEEGSYQVSAVSSNCTSVLSGSITIKGLSSPPTLKWESNPATANIGETKIYTVSMDYPQAGTYTWSTDSPNAQIITGQGTSSVAIKYNLAGNYVITIAASNSCGNAVSLTNSVTVGTACTNAVITGYSPASRTQSITSGNSAFLSIVATGTNLTYQWYSGNPGSGTIISGATNSYYNPVLTSTGTYTYYCVATPTGGCSSATSQAFTVTVIPDVTTNLKGSGTLAGKTIFDIAYSNDNSNGCAPLSGRVNQKTDFSNRTAQDPYAGYVTAPYSGVQVYTFTPLSAVTNVRFSYIDASGKVIDNITPMADYSGSIAKGGICKAKVEFKATLNQDARGLTRANALIGLINVTYTVGGTDYTVTLTASIADCGSCGAYSHLGKWVDFMCHNLGADESVDPFDAGNPALLGDLYQWGRNTDGHEKRNSPVTTSLGYITNPGPNFIYPNPAYLDWFAYSSNAALVAATTRRWGEGTLNNVATQKKGPTDPCPAGWRIPSRYEMELIFMLGSSQNLQTTKGTTHGIYLGPYLFFPTAGARTSVIKEVDTTGHYWTATPKMPADGPGDVAGYSYSIGVSPARINGGNSVGIYSGYTIRTTGASVRCISETAVF